MEILVLMTFDSLKVLSNESMDFNDPKEFDDPQVFDDPKGISIGGLDFDNPKVYGHVNQNALLEMGQNKWVAFPLKRNGQCPKE